MTTDDKRPRGSLEGVVHDVIGIKNLPQEFITIGKNFDEALGRCVLRDDEQRNAVIIYKAQLEMFEMFDEIQHLTNWLNASAAVGGFNRSQAIMAHARVYLPEGAGVKVDKNTQKALMEMQQRRRQAANEQENHNEND
jgi:hypothetical protein